ncbi:MAG: SBBP repeat-containing protein [Candidatus Thorarchaeota archaeon]
MFARKLTLIFLFLSLMLISQPTCVHFNERFDSESARINALSANSDFGTYFGGLGSEESTRITTDSEDNIILKLVTTSEDLPTSSTAFQQDYAGGTNDGFIAKFSPDGTLVFSTYLGGSSTDHIVRTVVDDDDNIYIVGSTYSEDFPITANALQSEKQGSEDGYITKISSNGTLLYSSYFGSAGIDRIQQVMLHEDGSIYLEGYTSSTGLATANAYQTSCAGGADSFIAKLSNDLDEVLMFTYYGGSGEDYGWRVDIDSEYNFIICGETRSTDLPTTPDAICRTYSGSTDGFFAKISSDGSELVYATYLGGSSVDFGGGVNIDSKDDFYITGVASSELANLDSTYEPHHGGMDFFAAKFTKDCELIFFRMVGGNRTDLMWDALLDLDENIIIVGSTFSDDYPIVNAVQEERMNGNDACVTVLSSDGEDIILSTYIGGSANEKGEGIAIQSDGSILTSGYSSSDDFPVSSNAYQLHRVGSNDAFLYRIDPTGTMPSMTETVSTITGPSDSLQNIYPIQIVIISGGSIAVVISGWFLMKRRGK